MNDRLPITDRNKVQIMLGELDYKYNPDDDLVCDAPLVTSTDRTLALCITNLLKIIDGLQAQIDELKADAKRKVNLTERIR